MLKAKNIYVLPVPKEAINKLMSGEGPGRPAHVDGRLNKEFGDERRAVDYYCPEGTPIFAAADGEVVWTKNDSNKGGGDRKFIREANGVTIKHANDEYTNYLHMKYKSVTVNVKQKVKAGQIIGQVGTTGWTPAPHLHFSVFRIYGKNPFVDYETLDFDIKK